MKRITTKKEFEKELEEAGDRLVAVDFTASWCSRHSKVNELLSEVMHQPEFSEVLFIQVDVDDNEDTPPSCQIDYLPTIQFYRDGRKNKGKITQEWSSLNEEFQLLVYTRLSFEYHACNSSGGGGAIRRHDRKPTSRLETASLEKMGRPEVLGL